MGLDMYAARKVRLPVDKRPNGSARVEQTGTDGTSVPGILTVEVTDIEEPVMQWRKANHIHAWFVDNVQNGNDDMNEYHVSWDKLRSLLSVCNRVIGESELVDGQVYKATVYNQKHPNGVTLREPGKVIKDATVARTLLPTRSGFFFGPQEYDMHYHQDVADTRDWIVRMLADHKNGVPGDIYYSSSW